MVIGFIGRLVPVKNPQMALGVCERVFRNGAIRRARLIVAGDGELRPKLQEEVRRAGLEDQILFTGWRQDLVNLYSTLDLVILTSLNEGTPVVLIEAMAAGLPFVATRVGGIMDLMLRPEQVICGVNDRPLFSVFANGVLAESGDVEGFTAALEYLVRDPQLMGRMGSEGREFVRDRFSKGRLLAEMQTLYKECLIQQGCSNRGKSQIPFSLDGSRQARM
jgi:glycosyltransferase involved in cell wall biosynthesis